ncbi:adenosine deaminase [Alkalihalobacterium bogoriense]|uniref:adenosine deaminase n=1 Tax=Alkalihalobacterium bogoriense TaxID=246272 RepID=UPI00047D63F1|nr:adenosine deaminase [Alkalihalobacterium bogoriense]
MNASVIKSLPKVDLHLHLDGSVKPNTLIELAKQKGVILPAETETELLPYMQVTKTGQLKDYLKTFDLVLPMMQTEEALERIAFEVVEQASLDNCIYIEVRFGPILHTREGLRLEQVISAVIKGLQRGESTFGVKARVIASCLRHHSVAENIAVIHAASSFLHKGLVAVDLAGDEGNFPTHLHQEVFAVANEKEIPVTIHAGEAAGPDSIYDAITQLGAVRIGHGVRAREDKDIVDLLIDKKIPLEMCPISNIQTKACDSWESYPFKEYYDMGFTLTINTDNLTVSNTTLTKEFLTLIEYFQLSLDDVLSLLRNGIEAAFLPEVEKQKLRERFESKLKNEQT